MTPSPLFDLSGKAETDRLDARAGYPVELVAEADASQDSQNDRRRVDDEIDVTDLGELSGPDECRDRMRIKEGDAAEIKVHCGAWSPDQSDQGCKEFLRGTNVDLALDPHHVVIAH